MQFTPTERVGFLRLLAVQDRLSEIFEGRAVDLHTHREIHPIIRGQIERQWIPIFPPEVVRHDRLDPGCDRVTACEKIIRYCKNRTAIEFFDDTRLFDAVLRNLTVWGEAAGRLDRQWTTHYPHVPWGAITGIRHRVVPDDGHVDPDIVWDTVQEDIPVILSQLQAIASEWNPDAP